MIIAFLFCIYPLYLLVIHFIYTALLITLKGIYMIKRKEHNLDKNIISALLPQVLCLINYVSFIT